ncbi:MAG: RNA polymerase sigma factor [Myxococcales bacterium]|nr:RNA polymerase sigma factor [Myxococcales bacterium]
MSDPQKLSQLYREYGPPVHRRARRMLQNDTDAEEALQDIFLRAFRNLDRFEDRGQTLNWLYRITTNHCLNVIRGRKRRKALADAYAAAPRKPNAPVDQLTMQMLLSQADDRLATVAVYVHLDGLSYAEAAELMECSKSTVRNLIEQFNQWAARRLGAEP